AWKRAGHGRSPGRGENFGQAVSAGGSAGAGQGCAAGATGGPGGGQAVMPTKILIVEDDAVTAHAYRACLERAGYAVAVATDGQAGLDYIQRTAPDGVLLDLMMPRMNGLQLLKSIRACHHLARIPIMVYTNAFVPSLVDEA